MAFTPQNVWAALTHYERNIWLPTSEPVWNIEGWWERFTVHRKMYECSCCGPKSPNLVYQQEMHKSDAEKIIRGGVDPVSYIQRERELVKEVVLAQLLLLVLLLWPCSQFCLWTVCSLMQVQSAIDFTSGQNAVISALNEIYIFIYMQTALYM